MPCSLSWENTENDLESVKRRNTVKCYFNIQNGVWGREVRKMKLIAGLGNPGLKYEATRHNAGFMTLDALALKLNVSFEQKKFQASFTQCFYKGEKLLLLKPETFMNLSGFALREAVNFYKLEAEDILVIYDDMDLLPGEIRVRRSGSAGGHNGMKSCIEQLGTDKINRIKIGIGHPLASTVVDYVLERFSREELLNMQKISADAADAALCWAEFGIQEAMNRYNIKNKVVKEKKNAKETDKANAQKPVSEEALENSAEVSLPDELA